MNKIIVAGLSLLIGCAGSSATLPALDASDDADLNDAANDTVVEKDSVIKDVVEQDTSKDTEQDTSSDVMLDTAKDVEMDTMDVADVVVVNLNAVDLKSAVNYSILGQSAISTVPSSKITGDLGISPAAASYITGFSLVQSGSYWTSSQVTGKIFAANNAPPTPVLLTAAVSDMHAAYTDAESRTNPDYLNMNGGELGGQTLKPGLYKYTTAVAISKDLVLEGSASDVWIFQVTGTITQAAGQHVILKGGALAKNVFWQVAGACSFGTTSHFEGVLLCKTAVSFNSGSSINGSIYSQTSISLNATTVN